MTINKARCARIFVARRNPGRLGMPNPLSILPSRLREFHPEEPARPGHELRTMRLLGRRRHPLSESRSRDDATLAGSGASITEPLRLVSVGPFHKPFSTAICQGDIHF